MQGDFSKYRKEENIAMDNNFNTLEEARAEILRLNQELASAQTAEKNYTTRIEELTRENENVRELNQKYFLELSAQYQRDEKDEDKEPDEKQISLEDFARTLSI